jgi:H/ACA ribonucleoprotein complex subunit 3
MKILYCKKCRIYTLKDSCKKCGGATINPKPARFSPPDPYGRYRRKLKMETA